jgi:hypothetical protein
MTSFWFTLCLHYFKFFWLVQKGIYIYIYEINNFSKYQDTFIKKEKEKEIKTDPKY